MAVEKISEMVDEDILISQEYFEKYSYDADKMESLYYYLVHRYHNVIEGFCVDFVVLQPFDTTVDKAKGYARNVLYMHKRLIEFRENGYSNEGLLEYYLRREYQEIDMEIDFTTLRLEIGMMKSLPYYERKEIIQKIDEIEEICTQVIFKKQKWERLREYLIWVSGKDVQIALKILPLFFKINHK